MGKLVTANQAAFLVRLNERAIRYRIRSGALTAQTGEDGHARLDVEDLASVPGWRVDMDRLAEIQEQDARSAQSLSERLRVLERRVATLERILSKTSLSEGQQHSLEGVGAIPGYPDAPRAASAFSARYRAIEAKGTLPDDLVIAAHFVESHGIPRMTWMGAMRTGRLPTRENEWKVGRSLVRHALDAEGRATVYQLWADRPDFVRCAQCPHA